MRPITSNPAIGFDTRPRECDITFASSFRVQWIGGTNLLRLTMSIAAMNSTRLFGYAQQAAAMADVEDVEEEGGADAIGESEEGEEVAAHHHERAAASDGADFGSGDFAAAAAGAIGSMVDVQA